MRFYKIFSLVCLAACFSFASLPSALAQNAPRVAIFFEPGFPFYNATPFTSPRAIAQNLKAIGFEVDLLNVNALSDTSRFHVARYDALVLPYGNTFPQAAFANLQAFHRAFPSRIR